MGNIISKKQTRINLFLILIILFGMNYSVWAQSVKVTGTVTDNLGLPIPGVSIIEKGTKKGVSTDIDGKYTFSTSQKSVLVFSYVGFETKEILVNVVVSNNVLINSSD